MSHNQPTQLRLLFPFSFVLLHFIHKELWRYTERQRRNHSALKICKTFIKETFKHLKLMTFIFFRFMKVYVTLTYISGVTYFLSTCINPFLYNLMSHKFRNASKVSWVVNRNQSRKVLRRVEHFTVVEFKNSIDFFNNFDEYFLISTRVKSKNKTIVIKNNFISLLIVISRSFSSPCLSIASIVRHRRPKRRPWGLITAL